MKNYLYDKNIFLSTNHVLEVENRKHYSIYHFKIQKLFQKAWHVVDQQPYPLCMLHQTYR